MKKYIAFAMALMMITISFAGCGSSSDTPVQNAPSSNSASTGDSTPSASPAETIVIDVGFGPTIDMPYGIAHEYWGQLLEEQSGGTMRFNIFPSDQLGSTKDTIDQCLTGDAVITSTDVSYFADLGVKDLMIIQAPYLCETWEEMDKIFNSDWFEEQSQLLEEKGIKVLAYNWRYGDRHTITKAPLNSPSDIQGMKIRVPQATAFVKGYEALGAAPTPMALNDVYTALQQGTIDGLENPIPTIYGGKYQEVAKYLTLDAHMKTINIMVCGTDFFNSLTPEQQELLMSTAREAGEYQNKIAAELEAEMIQDMVDNDGVTVTEIDYAEWKAAAEGFYDLPEFSDWTPGLKERIEEIKNA